MNADADVYTIEFATEEDHADYLKTAVEKSLYHLGTKTDSTENMLTLSTCTSSSEAGRFIVTGNADTKDSKGIDKGSNYRGRRKNIMGEQ